MHLYQIVTDNQFTRLIDIFIINSVDITFSTNATETDINTYKNVTVNVGVTLTFNTIAEQKSVIVIANTILNNGTILRTAQRNGAGAIYRISTDQIGLGGNGGVGDIFSHGGGGGGGIVYVLYGTQIAAGTLEATFGTGGSGQGNGAGSGTNGAVGATSTIAY